MLDAIRGLTFEDKSWVSARRNYWSEEGGNQFEEEEMENQEIVGEEGEMADVGALFREGVEEGEWDKEEIGTLCNHSDLETAEIKTC